MSCIILDIKIFYICNRDAYVCATTKIRLVWNLASGLCALTFSSLNFSCLQRKLKRSGNSWNPLVTHLPTARHLNLQHQQPLWTINYWDLYYCIYIGCFMNQYVQKLKIYAGGETVMSFAALYHHATYGNSDAVNLGPKMCAALL